MSVYVGRINNKIKLDGQSPIIPMAMNAMLSINDKRVGSIDRMID